MLLKLVLGLALILAGGAIVFILIQRLQRSERERWKSPFSEKLIRPAGESLRIKIDQIRDDLMEQLLIFVSLLMAPGLFALMLQSVSGVAYGFACGIVILLCALLMQHRWKRVKSLREALRRHQLAFDGERYVAEELNGLLSQGYRVFHDVLVDWLPGGPERVFNIDHVAIGPAGAFTVETKTRSKRNDHARPAGTAPKVEFNGKALRFDGGPWRAEAIEQARKGAETLGKWLNGTSPTPIQVRPIIAIPGWWVDTENYSTSGVRSAKGLATSIPHLGRGRRLTEAEIQWMGDKLEAHCRNLEGS